MTSPSVSLNRGSCFFFNLEWNLAPRMEKTGLSIEFEWRKVSVLSGVIHYLEWKFHFFMTNSPL
jgi:hypothetical protein